MRGCRITWKGTYTKADNATLLGLHTALQGPPYNFVSVGLPVRRTFMQSGQCVAAMAMYEQAMFSLLCMDDGMLYLTAMVRSSVNRAALKALIKSTFVLTNETVIEDEADL